MGIVLLILSIVISITYGEIRQELDIEGNVIYVNEEGMVTDESGDVLITDAFGEAIKKSSHNNIEEQNQNKRIIDSLFENVKTQKPINTKRVADTNSSNQSIITPTNQPSEPTLDINESNNTYIQNIIENNKDGNEYIKPIAIIIALLLIFMLGNRGKIILFILVGAGLLAYYLNFI